MLNAQMRWTSSFDKVIAFLEIGENKGGGVLQVMCKRREKPGGSSACACLYPMNSLSQMCPVVPSSPKTSHVHHRHIRVPVDCRRIRREKQWDWEIFCCVGFVSGPEMLPLLKSLLWLQLREKRVNIFSVENKKDKRLSALYLYPYCTTFL